MDIVEIIIFALQSRFVNNQASFFNLFLKYLPDNFSYEQISNHYKNLFASTVLHVVPYVE